MLIRNAIAPSYTELRPLQTELGQSPLKAVYTYGQPMIGSEALAEACNDDPFLGKRVFRYVYEKDPVPHLPSKDTGRWANYGIQSEYDSAARSWGVTAPVAQMHFIGELLEAFASFPAWQIPLLQRMPFKYRIDDHRPEHYIATLTPPGVTSEFGDYEYVPAPNRKADTVAEPEGRSLLEGMLKVLTKPVSGLTSTITRVLAA